MLSNSLQVYKLYVCIYVYKLCRGKRDGAKVPRRHYKVQLKQQLSLASIDHKGWEQPSADRNNWGAITRRAAENFEHSRREADEEKRRRRKETTSQADSDQIYVCPACTRGCKSRIGLYSHQKVSATPGGRADLPNDLQKQRICHHHMYTVKCKEAPWPVNMT